MNDPFEGPRLLVARAKENIADFETRCRREACGRQAADVPIGRLTKDTVFKEGRAKLRQILELLELTGRPAISNTKGK